MTNITCLHCGAENPLQSKYCNRCGASFSSDTTHVCPECSTLNPINLLYCDNCGTRLVDDSAPSQESDDDEDDNGKRLNRSEPFSLPERPPGQTGNLDVSAVLPDWLKTGDFSAEPGDPVDDDDLPWLRAAHEDEEWNDEEAPTLEELSRDHAPRDDLPTWLLDEDIAGVIFSAEKSTDELFMSSLQDNDDKEEASSELDVDPDETAAELQHWLEDMESEEPPATESDESRPASNETQDLSHSALSEMPEDDFLQWLSEIQQHAAENELDDTSEPPASPPTADEPPSPDTWEPEDIAEPPVTQPDDDQDDSDVPAWLVGDREDDLPEDATRAFQADASAAPEWLLEPVSDEHRELEDFAEQYEQELQEDEDELSGWSMDGIATSAAPETLNERADEPQDDEFLQWLDSVGMERERAVSDPGQIVSPTSDDDVLDGFASDADFRLPDWLGGLSEPDESIEIPDGPDIDALPDWLQELAPPDDEFTLPYVSGSATELESEDAEEEEPLPAAPSAEKPKTEESAAESDLPDWITAVTAELEDLEDAPQPAVEAGLAPRTNDVWPIAPSDEMSFEEGQMALDAQEVSGDDLPDWFSDIMADINIDESGELQGSATELSDVPQQLAGADLPDWLDSPFVDEEAAEPTPLEEIPEWLRAPLKERLARAAEERGLAEPTLDSGEEWRELLEAPLTDEERTEHRAQDAVPAWLESLRASARVGDRKAQHTEKDDAISPVAGIEGAISIAPVVSQAARREPIAGGSSKEQEQQILLLRQMARLQQDEMNIMAPAVGGAQPLPMMTRLLLALLLLGVVVAGILGGDLLSRLAPDASRSGLGVSIQELAEARAGEPALIVFDYTPSTAGALDPVAQRLLQIMTESQSPVLVTSQSASGLALAGRATAAGAPTAQSLGFIPGEALGVRRLGRCLAQEAPCTTLFGQDIGTESLALLAEATRVVVFAADRDSLLAWLEQLDSATAVSLNAVVTPALEPVALPYLASGQLETLIIADGTIAASLGANVDGNIAALNLTHWFVAATLFIGALYYLLIGLIRRRRT